MTYDYNNYWSKSFTKQKKEGFLAEIVEELKKIEFTTVLELGSGEGHLSQVLKKNFNINLTGMDIIGSNQYLDQFTQGNITKLPFDNYDLIVGRFILLHIKPEHIEALIDKINSSCKNLLFVDYSPLEQIQLNEPNFLHKYPWNESRLNKFNSIFQR